MDRGSIFNTMGILYRIGTVSKLTGIGIDTLRAWERRHAAVTPKRENRVRGYGQDDIARLILLRRAVEKGHAISSVAGLPETQLSALLAVAHPEARDSIKLIEPLFAALEDFDYAGLNEQLARMAAVLSASDLVERVVLPVMQEVGERWHRGELNIAQEHMMSGLVQQLLGALMRLYRPATDAPKLVYATPEGELHAVGLMAAAMLAASAGLSPIYLGASVPVKEILYAARRSAAKAVVLQVTDVGAEISEQVRKIVDGLPAGVEVWIGGRADLDYQGVLCLRDFSALKDRYRHLAAAA